MKRYCAWLMLLMLSLVAQLAHGDPVCSLDANPKSGDSPLATTVTWTTSGYSTLTAGSTQGWNGPIATASGSKKLTGITIPTKLTLQCDPFVPKAVTLNWTYDWTYTDATPVTTKAGFKVYYGSAADQLTQVVDLKDPSLLTADIPLAPGTWYFQMLAYTSYGDQSPRSNIVSRTLAAGQSVTVSVDLTVNKVLKAPVLQ
jgi:hypothetical protein